MSGKPATGGQDQAVSPGQPGDLRFSTDHGGFAVAVFGGALGCILLLFRKSTAFYLFIASLLGVIVTMIHALDIANSAINFSIFEIVMMILMPIIVAVLLIWFSKQAEGKGWIS